MSEIEIQACELKFATIEEAVSKSRYAKRMSYLLKNPTLGYKSLYKIEEFSERVSNCFGTVIFIVGGENSFLRSRYCHWEQEAIILGETRHAESCVFPANVDRPAYIGPRFMDCFLKNRCTKIPQKEKDCLIATRGKEIDDEGFTIGYGLLHTCIYLGWIEGKDWIMHQAMEGASYTTDKLRTYSNVERTDFYRYCPHRQL